MSSFTCVGCRSGYAEVDWPGGGKRKVKPGMNLEELEAPLVGLRRKRRGFKSK